MQTRSISPHSLAPHSLAPHSLAPHSLVKHSLAKHSLPNFVQSIAPAIQKAVTHEIAPAKKLLNHGAINHGAPFNHSAVQFVFPRKPQRNPSPEPLNPAKKPPEHTNKIITTERKSPAGIHD